MSEIRLYNEDCLPAMRLMKDKQYDLAICDPPYGINAPNMTMGSNPNRKGDGQYPGVSTTVKLKNKLQRLNGGGGQIKKQIA